MTGWGDHLVIAPIVLPLLAGTVLVLLSERRRALRAGIAVASAVALLVIAASLVGLADGAGHDVRVYRLGNWPSIFAIVLVLDRLSAMMVALVAVLGLAAMIFSLARWQGAGAHFHPLLQFQLMGLNGAFLTGDLFNLFVFFEVMLAASYGLAMHGSGPARVRAGLHYIAVNLVAALLFLIGVSVLYGVGGTLSMADLSARMEAIPAEDRALVEAGAALLGIALLIKAAMWPVGFWLPGTYAAASAPSAAILSVLSKVGICVVLRLWLMLFGDDAAGSAAFGGPWLMAGGLATIAFGSIAVLATQDLARLAGASVLVSSGTLLAAIGAGLPGVTAGALYYLVSSVLAIGAFFLLVELVERGREVGADVLAVTREAFGTRRDDDDPEDMPSVDAPIPGAMAVLGGAFLCCALILAGLPPLSGFLAKFAILAPLLAAAQGGLPPLTWLVLAALILSGLATLVAMLRAGIEAFWISPPVSPPRVAALEAGPIAALLALTVGLTIMGGPAMRYMSEAAASLHAPRGYIEGVLPPKGVTKEEVP